MIGVNVKKNSPDMENIPGVMEKFPDRVIRLKPYKH